MASYIGNLEDMLQDLEKANSLFNCICETYFREWNPDPEDLSQSYQDSVNIIYTIKDLVREQTAILRESINDYYDNWNEVKKLIEQAAEVVASLKGEIMK